MVMESVYHRNQGHQMQRFLLSPDGRELATLSEPERHFKDDEGSAGERAGEDSALNRDTPVAKNLLFDTASVKARLTD